MNTLSVCFIFLMFISIGFSHQNSNSHVYPRPLIAEYSEEVGNGFHLDQLSLEELKLRCTSWRFAVETNNLWLWKTVPVECGDYVKDYMISKAYGFDLERVSKESEIHAKSLEFVDGDGNGNGNGMDAWIFDIDETLLSNLPYYCEHGYGLEVFDHVEFDKWVEKGEAPAIKSSLELYRIITRLGFKVFLLTGRSERHRNVTVDNLNRVGLHHWDKLILRSAEDHNKKATIFKSEKRDELIKEGYRIVGNSGDQWSDLLGSSMAIRSFKLPNPMYYIP